MWIRLIKARLDNPLFVQARRRLRRRWWKSWVAPGLVIVLCFYSLLVAAYFDVGFGGTGAQAGVMAQAVLRMFLLTLSPLITLFGFFAGVRAVQGDRERGTIESLLLTDLTNLELMAGKILGSLLPFLFMIVLMIPAVVEFGTAESVDIPALFTKNWRLKEVLESFWYLPHWELLIYILFGATLGVIYGVHRAAQYRRPSMIYSSGILTFVILIPFGLVLVSHLFQSLTEVLVRTAYGIIAKSTMEFEPFKPIVRVIGMALAAWLVSLIPLFELAEQFRYLCGEERDPRELVFRRPPSSPSSRPVPWSPVAAKPKDIWADYEERTRGKAKPRSAIVRREDREPPP